MIRLFLFTLLLSNSGFLNVTHEYYVSLTEITYSPDKQRLEVISRVFHDDFEKVLKARYDDKLVFRPSEQSKDIEAFINLYFDEKFKISIDNSPSKIEYLGYKFDQDRVNIFLKIENVEDFKVINLENLLLTDVFEDQKNIVHCFKLNQKKSVLLTRFDSEAMLKFN